MCSMHAGVRRQSRIRISEVAIGCLPATGVIRVPPSPHPPAMQVHRGPILVVALKTQAETTK